MTEPSSTSPLIAAFSGGKDSTAMVLLLSEQREQFDLLFTPTGDESPECLEHVRAISVRVGMPLAVRWSGDSLSSLIEKWNALPNWRQRWCTRALKIEPARNYLIEHPGSTLCVGLRSDEPDRAGLWGDFASYRYPLREAGMSLGDVMEFLDVRGVCVPARTDCQLCFYQRLIEWWELWRDFPEKFAQGEAMEAATGHTFRSNGRDTWPASLAGLRREFEAGRVPRDTRERVGMCRVCSL
jgi:hypothetical protein